MREPYGAGGRTALRLTGDIEITLPDDEAHLTGLELEKEGAMIESTGAFHLELMGTMSELRKLGVMRPDVEEALAPLGDDDGAPVRLRFSAEPDLVADLAEVAAELGEDCAPDELLSDPVWASLAFSLHRYVPESASYAEA